MDKKYYWNLDEKAEYWHSECESIKECLEEARIESEKESSVFIGELKEFKPSVCVDRVLDFIVDDAYDEAGELADGFLDGVSNDIELELEEGLNEALNKWLDRHRLRPSFGSVENVKEYDLETGNEIK